jgi:hypothetical protein
MVTGPRKNKSSVIDNMIGWMKAPEGAFLIYETI